jgi:hypothetical protein
MAKEPFFRSLLMSTEERTAKPELTKWRWRVSELIMALTILVLWLTSCGLKLDAPTSAQLTPSARTVTLSVANPPAAGPAITEQSPPSTVKEIPDVIRSRAFEVVNDAGTTVATITGNDRGGMVTLYNIEGKQLLAFGVGEKWRGTGSVCVYNAQGETVALIGGNEDGGGLVIADSHGRVVGGIYAEKNGGGRMDILNGQANPVVVIKSDEDSNGVVLVANARKGYLASIRGQEDGSGSIDVYNRDGKSVARLTSDRGGNGGITIHNSRSDIAAVLMVDEDGTGKASVFDKMGRKTGGM